MELFIKTDLPFDDFAKKFRILLNAANTNQTSWRLDQHRYSDNLGGSYYLFEVFGLSLSVLQNHGEVEIPEHSDCAFYIMVQSDVEVPNELMASVVAYLQMIITRNIGTATMDDVL